MVVFEIPNIEPFKVGATIVSPYAALSIEGQ
jgi:hypothetical protein